MKKLATAWFLPGFLLALTLAPAACTTTPTATTPTSTTPTSTTPLAGEWKPVSATLGGQDYPVSNYEGGTLHLTDDTYEFAGDRGHYALLPGHFPAHMDIRGSDGPNAGRTMLAICELAGDRLTICYQLGDGERPREFASPQGSKIMLVRYERVP